MKNLDADSGGNGQGITGFRGDVPEPDSQSKTPPSSLTIDKRQVGSNTQVINKTYSRIEEILERGPRDYHELGYIVENAVVKGAKHFRVLILYRDNQQGSHRKVWCQREYGWLDGLELPSREREKIRRMKEELVEHVMTVCLELYSCIYFFCRAFLEYPHLETWN